MQKIDLLKRHVHEINKILLDNKKYFHEGFPTVVRSKKNPFNQKQKEYEVSCKLYLKSRNKEIIPCIEIYEKWIDDNMIDYKYRLDVPFVDFLYACKGVNEKVYDKSFEFRYELHGSLPDHQPKHHLHVLDNVPPRYPTHKIEFEDFFDVIEREFINNNGLVDFKS